MPAAFAAPVSRVPAVVAKARPALKRPAAPAAKPAAAAPAKPKKTATTAGNDEWEEF